MNVPGKKTCLIVIDGWGISPNTDTTGDAIRNAKTPIMDKLSKDYPTSSISAHGLAVGLPEGLMGNSEVGHLNIGAGRVVYQDIVRIELAVKNKQISHNPELISAFKRAKEVNGRLHFLGLVSDGGVHSHILHLFSLLEAAKEYGVKTAFIHFFADGRDTSPKSTSMFLKQLLDYIQLIKYGNLATITGRYYAMDRDKRWERVSLAYDGLVSGKGEHTDNPLKTVEERYANGETDEFLKPIIVNPDGVIEDNDTLVFFNFRSDRMRQLCQVLGKIDGSFPYDVSVEKKNLAITTMTQYKAEFPFPVLFPPQKMDNVLAEWLSKLKINQCHIAETEKYAHVTFFFNGGSEKKFDLEDRFLVPSPKVATYDLVPEMSAIKVGEEVAKTIATKKYPFVMCNLAPPDMVGHTGKYEEAIKAVEATDKSIGIIYEACKSNGYILFVTADHGNAEKMLSDDLKTPHTAHTTAPVPVIMTCRERSFKDFEGALCNVAPTILEVMGCEIPEEMADSMLKK